jgi:hypothetical protein
MFERSKAGVLSSSPGWHSSALAFLSNAIVPALMYKDLPELTAEALVNDQRAVSVGGAGASGTRSLSRLHSASVPRTTPRRSSG